MNLKNITKWQKQDTQDHILYESIYIAHPEKSEFLDTESRSVAAWKWERDQLWVVMRDLLEGMKMF